MSPCHVHPCLLSDEPYVLCGRGEDSIVVLFARIYRERATAVPPSSVTVMLPCSSFKTNKRAQQVGFVDSGGGAAAASGTFECYQKLMAAQGKPCLEAWAEWWRAIYRTPGGKRREIA